MWPLQNPVLVRESRARMRGKRVFWVLGMALAVMSIALAMFYAAEVRGRAYSMSRRGKDTFMVLMMVQTALICLITPAFSCGAFTLERDRKTFDLLTTTLLRPRTIVFGKLLSSLYYIFLLILAPLPLFFFCLLFGGLSPGQILLSTLLVVVTAIGLATTGLYVSLRFRRTPVATAVAYGVMLFLVAGVPFLGLMCDEVLNLDWVRQEEWYTITCPFAGLISVFETRFDVDIGSLDIQIWVLTVTLYALLTLLMLWLSIRGFRGGALKEKSTRTKKPSGGRASLPSPNGTDARDGHAGTALYP